MSSIEARHHFARVDALLREALELAPEERERWLERLRADDPSLHDELRRLIRYAERDDDSLVPHGAMRGPLWDELRRDLRLNDDSDQPLRPGSVVAGYVVQRLLGSGGMGEVYRARDQKLEREVAIKSLSSPLRSDGELLQRFEREAKLLASLNHPNIAAIYDLILHRERPFLVLELVEGETLQERLDDGPIPWRRVVEIARQVTEALEEAHNQGIVHRDLKPSNVKITPTGRVKVLDFGLAKDIRGRMGFESTGAGRVMGTAPYMSPEQVNGLSVDRRVDLWSLGCLLYEMLSGERAFSRGSVADTMAAIVSDEVDLSKLPAEIPSQLARLVRRCLEKNPEDRLQHVGDARIELVEIEGALVAENFFQWTAHYETGRIGFPWGRRALGAVERWVWMSALVLAVVVGVVATRHLGKETRPVTRLAVTLPTGSELAGGASPQMALSPDGRTLAYVAIDEAGRRRLHLRSLSRFDSVVVGGAESARSPFFSPDGQWVGYFSGKRLMKVSVQGGAPLEITRVAAVSRGASASWGEDGAIVMAPARGWGLFRVASGGGEAETLTTPDARLGETDHRWPQVIHGGARVLFTNMKRDGGRVAVLDTRTRRWRTMDGSQEISGARYVADGYLVYAHAGELLAAAFDPLELRVRRAPRRVLTDISTAPDFGLAFFSVSRSGSLVYVPGSEAAAARSLSWIDPDGRNEPIGPDRQHYRYPTIAPDGRRVAVTATDDGEDHIWIYDLSRGTKTRVTHGGSDVMPVWHPDGRLVCFMSSRSGPIDIYCRRVDETSDAFSLVNSPLASFPNAFSPDGSELIYYEIHPETGRDLWVKPMNDGPPRPLVVTDANERAAKLSPHGKWLAYVSDASGRDEVYVTAYPGLDRGWVVSRGGGSEPLWARSGQRLFFRNGDGLMSVDLPLEPSAQGDPSAPQHVLSHRFVRNERPAIAVYDVDASGNRFLVIESEGRPTVMHVVTSWLDELERTMKEAR